MHQPYYRDDMSGEIVMPWVFLHAIKDYYDMPWYLEQIPGIKATFNLVPSLLIQLKAYEDFEVKDKLLIALRKEVNVLRPEQRLYLAEHLFYANVENMIKPLPRYFALYEKKMQFETNEEVSAGFSQQEFLDLEVLYLLSWCGVYLRENDEIVKSLLHKGANFTHEEKLTLLKALSKFIKTIIPYYKKLMEKGRIEVSTTPFNHPISPLLLDIQNGKRANPDTAIPQVEGDLRGDAIIQTERAIDYYEKTFGQKPVGFWPAEGAVSYSFLNILSDHEIKWAASDEEILYKTIKRHDKNAIYQRNRLHFEKGSIALFFRDHALSDLLGFTYSGWNAEQAVEDFIGRLKAIHDSSANNTLVNVILDGENAWEYYPDNAYEFFKILYTKLSTLSWCKTATMAQSMQNEQIPEFELFALEPGSWIGGNFNIWIGHPEKNRAWELIYQTRSDYEKVKDSFSEEVRRKILKEFLIAESSDWFWWYGDDHHTVEKDTFDALFRKHLINVYHLMEQLPPDQLFHPIVTHDSKAKKLFLKEPVSRISPQIDGRQSYFLEWLGAGEMDLLHELSAMNMQDFQIQKLLMGWDDTNCYFAMYGEIESLIDKAEIVLQTEDYECRYPIQRACNSNKKSIFASQEIFELAIDKAVVWDKEIRFQLVVNGQIAQQIPLYAKIRLSKMDHLEKYWFI
jgi:alpha-amylase/alpha-mannosidase (GH57 family)